MANTGIFYPGSEDIYYAADAHVISTYGKKYSRDLRVKVLGTTEQMSAQIIVDELQLPITPFEYQQEVKKILHKTLPDAALMPGRYLNYFRKI